MELIRELFNELTLVHQAEPRTIVESQAKVKQVRSGLDGLFKVLIWRLEGSINAGEFRQLYHEWLRKKGLLERPL